MNKVTLKKVGKSNYLIHIQQDMDIEVRLSPSSNPIQQSSDLIATNEKANNVFPSTDCCTYSDKEGIFIRQNHYYRKYLFSQIIWVEASGSYSFIHLSDESKIIVTHPLAAIEKKLPPEKFMRIHRQYIIHLDFVDAFIGNTVCIGKQHFPVSIHCQKKLYSCFNFLDSVKIKNRNKQ